ncbi:MAG: hypothetical protein JXA96_01630 [Sedimentisphaerales bacterium]|nr:hypothetical protein [Sedimentisphaerales bacterium]
MGIFDSWKRNRLVNQLKNEESPATENISKLINLIDNQPLLDCLKNYELLKPEAGREKTGYLDPKVIIFNLVSKKDKHYIIPDGDSLIQAIAKATEDLSSHLTAAEAAREEFTTIQQQCIMPPAQNAQMFAKVELAHQTMQAAIIGRVSELNKIVSVKDFLENSTVNPFFQKYSKGGVRIEELVPWLEMNAMANIICNHTQPKYCATSDTVLKAISIVNTADAVIQSSEKTVVQDDDLFLRASPIERKRMQLLWTDAEQLEILEMAVANGAPAFFPDENGKPQVFDITKEDVSWAIKVDIVAAKAAEAASRNDYRTAITFYKNALKLAPGADIYLMSIGCCYENLGQKQDALSYLKRAQDISPQNTRIKNNLEALQSKTTINTKQIKTELLPWGSIRNVWLVIDKTSLPQLQRLDRVGQMTFAVNMARQLADDVFSSIQKWMETNTCAISIMLFDPLVENKVVDFIRSQPQPDPRSAKCLKECGEFMLRTGTTPSGVKVAIVIGRTK